MRKTLYSRLFWKILSGIVFCGFSLTCLAQGTQITTNTHLNIASGTTYVETHSLNTMSGGSVNNSGTIILNGNLVNLNSSLTNLGTGTFQFSGSTLQTISGQNIMNNVTVNNSAGLTLGGNTEIDGQLTLTSGLVTLGSYNLLLGSSAPTIAGSPSSSNMIVATGSGQLQKAFTTTGSFTFPVGDAGPYYSPVTLNFLSGTFGTGAYAGVNLVASAYPGLTGDYLNRYWNVTQSNISSFTASAQFNYVPSDITGSAANIYGIRVLPSFATYNLANTGGTGSNYVFASGLTTFGTFTGGHTAVSSTFSAFLQGPYNVTNHNMNNTLATLLPLGSRSDNTKFPNSQPYNGAPWNYSGTESVSSLPANVVDWVLVELRHGSSPATATALTNGRAAGFILKNGSIVGTDGSSPLTFMNVGTFSDNLYPVIYHRNHLVTMANNPSSQNANQVYTYNYYSGDGTQMYGAAKIQVEPGIWAMAAGDADQDKQVQSSDFNLWSINAGLTSIYISCDFDLSGGVQSSDFNLWSVNAGLVSIVP